MKLKRNALRIAMLTAGVVLAVGSGAGASYADTSGDHSIGSGNQVSVPVHLPVNVCGNAVAVIGGGLAHCTGGASAPQAHSDISDSSTSGVGGILSGNQVDVPITAPVNVCGNSVPVIGAALSNCTGGASVSGGASQQGGYAPGAQAPVAAQAAAAAQAPAAAVRGAAGDATKGGGSVVEVPGLGDVTDLQVPDLGLLPDLGLGS